MARQLYDGALEHIHIELSTRCNASCPMCPRTLRGTTNPALTLQELSARDICTILPETLLAGLRHVDLCGVFGDPLMASELDEIIAYLRGNESLRIDIYTNGSLRSSEWWSQLAQKLGTGSVIFGIDGLADTHDMYRVGTRFERVLANARAFINGGGRAQWDFLVFRHNEHQVEEARRLSTELGFAAFSPKVSGRFYKRYYEDVGAGRGDGLDTFPVFDARGTWQYNLDLPTNTKYQNTAFQHMQNEITTRGTLNAFLQEVPIVCRVAAAHSCFVSAEATVFPCCWTYSASKNSALFGMSDPHDLAVAQLVTSYGLSSIDARKRALTEIVTGALFSAIASAWEGGALDKRLKVCARMCGDGPSQFDAQFTEPSLAPTKHRYRLRQRQ